MVPGHDSADTAVTGHLYMGAPIERSSSTGRDADGTRVAKGTITNWSAGCDTTQNGFTMTASYILGPGNEQLAELSWSGGVPTPVHTNIWAGGQLTATYSYDDPINYPAGILYFPLTDWLPGSPATGLRRWGGLGTRRMLADQYGNLAQTCDSLPFGDGESCPTTPTEHLFTGKERDSESGNDYFGARYYASTMGRFMSPDPLPWIHWQQGNKNDQGKFAAYIANPQNFNFYAYVLNNPLNKTDPTGMYQCNGTADQCGAVRAGLDAIRNADANLKAGTSGKALLDKALQFYGAENTDNGVNINFNNHDANALGSTSTDHGVTTISFGANALTPLGPTGKAETVAHEGTHGVDQKTSGRMPSTFWQFYGTEYHAYQAESAVDKGLGAANETDEHSVWFPGITPQQRTTNITRDAYSNACLDVGGCQ